MNPNDRTAALAATSTVRLWCRSGLAQKIREGAGMSRAELAELAGVTSTAVLRWESRQRVPTGEHAVRYHDALVQLQEFTAAAEVAS